MYLSDNGDYMEDDDGTVLFDYREHTKYGENTVKTTKTRKKKIPPISAFLAGLFDDDYALALDEDDY